jgi:membrane protease YdiL (CAAX protease family)
MNANRNELAKATIYYLLAIGLCALMAVLVTARDMPEAIGFVMFTPLTAVLLTMLVFTRDGYHKAGWQALGLQRAGWRLWPLGFGLPLVLLASSYVISTAVGVASWHWPANTSAPAFAANLLGDLLIGTVFAFGEEIGWRGYLLPRLLGLGRTRALLLSGFLHGAWHLPVILMTTTYHSEGNRLIVVPLFLLTLTTAGIFFGYLRLRGNSTWPAAFAHGAFNTIWSAFAAVTVPTSPLWMEYLSGESGLVTLVLAIVAVSLLLRRMAVVPSAFAECKASFTS